MNTNLIAQNIKMNFGGTIPSNVEEIIEQMAQAKSLGIKTEEKMGISTGLFIAIKKEIQDYRASNAARTSSEDARADRILRIRNSDGKATSRK